jgi:TP901-1 family phage major tail protein
MPATAGILNGTDLLVYDNTSKIAYSQSCKLALNMNLRNTSNKDSAGWETNLTGEKSWSVEVSGLVALDTAYNLAYFMNLILNGSTVALKFKTANLSDYYYSGTAYLTSCNVEASNQANVTYSLSLKGTGALALNGSTP